jgi:hypothetical protein
LGGERAARWLTAGRLCHTHSERARLADGQSLAEYVRGAPFQLEGSLLGFVLNPLLVDGRRAWSDWAAGGYGVWAELSPSDDLCEFQAQHFPEGLKVLRDLHAHRALLGKPVTPRGLYEYSVAVADPGAYPRLDRLIDLSRLSDRYAELRAAIAGKTPPPEELLNAVAAVPAGDATDGAEFLRRVGALLALAERRFAPRP